MSEANELRGVPQDLASETKMALLEAAQCANALLDDHSLAQRAAAMAGLSRRRVDELRAMYVTPDQQQSRPRHAEAPARPMTTSGGDRGWQASGAGTVVILVLVCAVALAGMRVLLP